MIFFPLFIIYIAGCVKAFVLSGGYLYSRNLAYLDPKESFLRDDYSWMYSFDKSWNKILKSRKEFEIERAFISLGSWASVLGYYLGDGALKDMVTLPPLTNKEEFFNMVCEAKTKYENRHSGRMDIMLATKLKKATKKAPKKTLKKTAKKTYKKRVKKDYETNMTSSILSSISSSSSSSSESPVS